MECTSDEKHKSEGFFLAIRMVKMMLETKLETFWREKGSKLRTKPRLERD